MIGRGSRILKNKKTFDVIDLGNNFHRFGSWGDDLDWQKIIIKIKTYISEYTSNPGITSTLELEEECLELLRPFLIEVPSETENGGDFGCFNFNLKDETTIAIHLTKDFAPDSPFAHKSELLKSLKLLTEKVITNHPNVKYIMMHSWLASFPKFAELFPEEWLKNARPLGPDSGNGCWGQFVDKSGGFNYRNANILRKTGQFSFPYTKCVCEIKNLEFHLNNI